MLIHPFTVNKDSAVLSLHPLAQENEFYDEHGQANPFFIHCDCLFVILSLSRHQGGWCSSKYGLISQMRGDADSTATKDESSQRTKNTQVGLPAAWLCCSGKPEKFLRVPEPAAKKWRAQHRGNDCYSFYDAFQPLRRFC